MGYLHPLAAVKPTVSGSIRSLRDPRAAFARVPAAGLRACDPAAHRVDIPKDSRRIQAPAWSGCRVDRGPRLQPVPDLRSLAAGDAGARTGTAPPRLVPV